MPPGAMEYCKVCDKRFGSHAEYHHHKLESSEHITCDVCSADFHDLKALKSHRDRLHALEQDLTCTACGSHFTRAGSLMSHYEHKDCTKYRTEDLDKLRQRKQEIKLKFEELAAEGSMGRPSPSPYTTNFPANAQDDGWNCSQPESDDEDMAFMSPSTKACLAVENGFVPLLHSLTLTTDNVQFKQVNKPSLRTTFERDDLIGIYAAATAKDYPALDSNSANGVNIPVSSKPLDEPDQPPVEMLASTKIESFSIEPTEAVLYDPDNGSFNPQVYYNIFTQQYKCPFKACRKSQKTPQSFHAHLRSPAHRGKTLRCCGCLRYFASVTALTQHSESQGTRCKIRETDQYGKAIDDFTAGYVGIDGELPDNTIKYKAVDPMAASGMDFAKANKKANEEMDVKLHDFWKDRTPMW